MSKKPTVLDIDPYRLEVEWARQPKLMRSWASKKAEADNAVREAKDMVELVKAQLDHRIRRKPGAFGVSKVTDASVASTITFQKAFRDAQIAYNSARLAADMISATVTALEHRKKALENMVSLLLNDYYAEPRVPKKAAPGTKDRLRELQKQSVRSGVKRVGGDDAD